MAWMYILMAGVLEIGWIFSLKSMDGFTKLFPWIFSYLICGLGVAFFLSLSMKIMPTGSVFAIWVGVVSTGINLIGILFMGEPYKLSRIAFVCMIMVGVIGLKLSTNE
jgi:quaternary ammonium compound-resistance protein SugE